MSAALKLVSRVLFASLFFISGITSFMDGGAGQLGYAAHGLKSVGIEDASLVAACFWIAKALEVVGGLLLAAAPLAGVLGFSERASEKLGAALLGAFLAAVTPLLHKPDPKDNYMGFLKNVMLFGACLYIFANDAAEDVKKQKSAKAAQ